MASEKLIVLPFAHGYSWICVQAERKRRELYLIKLKLISCACCSFISIWTAQRVNRRLDLYVASNVRFLTFLINYLSNQPKKNILDFTKKTWKVCIYFTDENNLLGFCLLKKNNLLVLVGNWFGYFRYVASVGFMIEAKFTLELVFDSQDQPISFWLNSTVTD